MYVAIYCVAVSVLLCFACRGFDLMQFSCLATVCGGFCLSLFLSVADFVCHCFVCRVFASQCLLGILPVAGFERRGFYMSLFLRVAFFTCRCFRLSKFL